MVKFHLDRDNWNISYGYFESFVGIFFDLTQTCLSPAFKIQHEVLTQWIERFLYLAILTWGFDKIMFKLYLLPIFKRYISTIWKIKTLILSCPRHYTPPTYTLAHPAPLCASDKLTYHVNITLPTFPYHAYWSFTIYRRRNITTFSLFNTVITIMVSNCQLS